MDASQNDVIFNHEARLNNLGSQVRHVESAMSAGIAGAYAMNSMATAPVGKKGLGFGTGRYNGESAIAIGYTQTEALQNDKAVAIKINGSFNSTGSSGMSVGATYFF